MEIWYYGISASARKSREGWHRVWNSGQGSGTILAPACGTSMWNMVPSGLPHLTDLLPRCRALQGCWMLHPPQVFLGCRRSQEWCCPSSRSQEASLIKWFIIPGLPLHGSHAVCMGKVTSLPLSTAHCCPHIHCSVGLADMEPDKTCPVEGTGAGSARMSGWDVGFPPGSILGTGTVQWG